MFLILLLHPYMHVDVTLTKHVRDLGTRLKVTRELNRSLQML